MKEKFLLYSFFFFFRRETSLPPVGVVFGGILFWLVNWWISCDGGGGEVSVFIGIQSRTSLREEEY